MSIVTCLHTNNRSCLVFSVSPDECGSQMGCFTIYFIVVGAFHQGYCNSPSRVITVEWTWAATEQPDCPLQAYLSAPSTCQ